MVAATSAVGRGAAIEVTGGTGREAGSCAPGAATVASSGSTARGDSTQGQLAALRAGTAAPPAPQQPARHDGPLPGGAPERASWTHGSCPSASSRASVIAGARPAGGLMLRSPRDNVARVREVGALPRRLAAQRARNGGMEGGPGVQDSRVRGGRSSVLSRLGRLRSQSPERLRPNHRLPGAPLSTTTGAPAGPACILDLVMTSPARVRGRPCPYRHFPTATKPAQ